MSITVTQLFAVAGSGDSSELVYGVEGTEDEFAAIASMAAAAPLYHGTQRYKDYSYEHVGYGLWRFRLSFSTREKPEPGSSKYSFDVSAGTQHITQSLATVGRYGAEGDVRDPPDFKGAINVHSDGVDGVDITIPVSKISETHYLPLEMVTSDYRQTVEAMVGRMNVTPFRGYAQGEALFTGARGSLDTAGEMWEVGFEFAISRNRQNIPVGDVIVAQKLGWDYLWAAYWDEEDEGAKQIVKRPYAAYVERVYEWGFFSYLGIGD